MFVPIKWSHRGQVARIKKELSGEQEAAEYHMEQKRRRPKGKEESSGSLSSIQWRGGTCSSLGKANADSVT
jgi:hypothetical protein